MRKTLNTILIVIVGLLALVACTPQASLTDELVPATLMTPGRARALIADVDFDIEEVDVWKYTAQKADNGLTTGATTTQVPLDEKGQTKGLSQGSWNFNLYGYKVETVKAVEDEGEDTKTEKLICSGYVDNANVTLDDHSITITVKPSQTKDGIGKIVIDESIEIADSEGTPYSKKADLYQYTKNVSVYKGSSSDVFEDYENAPSGVYKVVVKYTATTNKGAEYTAAEGVKTFNVYDNLTTKVSGTVKESVQAAKITGEGVFSADATGTIPEADTALSLEVAATPLGTEVKIDDTTTAKTTVEFPANSLTATGDESKEVTLSVTTTSIETASSTYSVADNGATVAAFDLTLTGATIAEDNSGIEITTYVIPGLDKTKLSVKYVEDETDSTATIKDYDSKTGLLTFIVKHFSEYIVTTNEVIAYDHDSLCAAIDEGKDVKLVCDITLKNKANVYINKSMTIDFNGKTITRNKNSQFNIGTAFPFNESTEIIFKNGTLEGIEEDSPIYVYKTLVLDNMVVNCFTITTQSRDYAFYVVLGKDYNTGKYISNVKIQNNSAVTVSGYTHVIWTTDHATTDQIIVENSTITLNDESWSPAEPKSN